MHLSVLASSLIRMAPGWPSRISNLTLYASAVALVMERILSSTIWRVSGLRVRVLMRRMAFCGITLPALPARNAPTLTTAASIGATLRETTVCSDITSAAPATSGSMLFSGMEPWLPTPVSSISQLSTAAMIGPPVKCSLPTGRPGMLCMPKITSIGNFSNRPSAIMAGAPAITSSAGWKITFSVPLKFFVFARYSAAPSSMALCASCPHMCDLPSILLLYGRSEPSCTGRASVSARSPMRALPSPTLSWPTTPVLPMPSVTSYPHSRSLPAM